MKRLLMLATALTGLAVLTPAALAQDGTKITIGADVDAGTLDPRLTTDTTAYRTTDLIYAGLITLTPSLEAKPDLAESWESPDPTTYVFHLRAGLKFSDGSPLTADDVVYTFTKITDKSFNAPDRALYSPQCRILLRGGRQRQDARRGAGRAAEAAHQGGKVGGRIDGFEGGGHFELGTGIRARDLA